MSRVTGARILAEALQREGVQVVFHLTGAPNIELTAHCERLGMRLYTVRHEQAAAAAAKGYARVSGRPGVCLAPAGPAVANMLPGIADAFHEQVPLIALGGSSPLNQRGHGAFQEMDQVALVAPAAKATFQATRPEQLPRLLRDAFRVASAVAPGPAYLDLPGDVLAGKLEADRVQHPPRPAPPSRPRADPAAVERAVERLARARRPLVVTGSGILWSGAGEALRAFIDATGIPFFTTPQGRGAVPEDHPRSFPAARTLAFREADVVLAVGTRANFIVSYFMPPRWSPDLELLAVNLDESELGSSRPPAVGMLADARAALEQFAEAARGRFDAGSETPWIERLRRKTAESDERQREAMQSGARPIHPLRLMAEIRSWLDRDAVLVEDGHDTLGFCRHTLHTHVLGHRMNPGVLGNVGVGVPVALGAKAARPDTQVVLVSGDSAFGWNGMEMASCCLQNLPIVVVVLNNAGITARSREAPMMPGQDLGHVDYQKVCEAFGGHGERVEDPAEIRPALERAMASGRPSVVNVIVDPFVPSATHVGFAGVMSESYGR